MRKFSGVYLEWNEARVKAILHHYGEEFFNGADVLEVGCGYGEMGYELQKLGANVTYVDVRQDHLDFIKERDPDSKTILMDIDKDFPSGKWDLVVHFGVLYHLQNPRENLKKACAVARHMVLETEVIDSNDPKAFKKQIDPDHYTQSISKIGVRMSPPGVEEVLEDCSMEFERLWTTECNVGAHRYGWKAKNNKGWTPGQRRFWFVKRKDEE